MQHHLRNAKEQKIHIFFLGILFKGERTVKMLYKKNYECIENVFMIEIVPCQYIYRYSQIPSNLMFYAAKLNPQIWKI